MPLEHDYYRQLAIRTGSAEYSKKIASAWVKKGYVGTSKGLQLVSKIHNEIPTWKSEREFIEWLGMDYLHPNKRI